MMPLFFGQRSDLLKNSMPAMKFFTVQDRDNLFGLRRRATSLRLWARAGAASGDSGGTPLRRRAASSVKLFGCSGSCCMAS